MGNRILDILGPPMVQIDPDVFLLHTLENALHILGDLIEPSQHLQKREKGLAGNPLTTPALATKVHQERLCHRLNIKIGIQNPRTFLHTQDRFG